MVTVAQSAESTARQMQERIEFVRKEVLERIDQIHRRYLVNVSGQDAIDISTELEAKDFLAQPVTPTDNSLYPFLAAELGISGATMTEVANDVLARAALLRQVAAPTKFIRMYFETQIAAAVDIQQVNAAREQAFTFLSAFG